MGGQKRLDASSEILPAIGEEMGTSFDRSDGYFYESPSDEVQLVPLGSKCRSSRRLFTSLVRRKQLRKSPLQSDRANSFENKRRRSILHHYSSPVASATLVQQSVEDERRSPDLDSQSPRHVSSRIIRQRRTSQQPEVESSSIQGIWKESTQDWSNEAQSILSRGLRPTTLKHYNALWKRFLKYCEENNLSSLPAEEKTVVDFLCQITTSLSRPVGTVNQAIAAIRQAHLAKNLADPSDSHLVKIFRNGIANARTTRAQKKATPIDVNALTKLFLSWEENEDLSQEKLRQKSLALCSLVGMFRPSEGALLQKDKIYFHEDLEWMEICMLGFKTDGQALSETIRIWKSSVNKLCPVQALHLYIERFVRSEQLRIFPLSPQRISTILKSVITAAGMDGSVITGRSFRSGGATAGIQNGVKPDQLMKIGRWKTPEVFYNNYVAARPDQDTTDRMLALSLDKTEEDVEISDEEMDEDETLLNERNELYEITEPTVNHSGLVKISTGNSIRYISGVDSQNEESEEESDRSSHSPILYSKNFEYEEISDSENHMLIPEKILSHRRSPGTSEEDEEPISDPLDSDWSSN
jgi:hypothetical protein